MSELTCVEINKISVYVNASTTTFAFDHNHHWLQEALQHKVLSEESFRKVCRPFQVDFLINIIVTIKEKSHGQFLQKYHWSWFEMMFTWRWLPPIREQKRKGNSLGLLVWIFFLISTSDQPLMGIRTDEDKYAGFPCSLGKPSSIHPGKEYFRCLM